MTMLERGNILSAGLCFRRLEVDDFAALERQPSQWLQLGEDATPEPDDVIALAAQPEAWAAIAPGGRIVALLGIVESHPGQQGLAWAILSARVGAHHLAVTRFARWRIEQAPLARVEALAKGPNKAETIARAFPGLDAGQLLAAVMPFATPEMRWARLCGLTPVHVLRRYGAADETYVLCERISDHG